MAVRLSIIGVVALVASTATSAESHLQQNPVYRKLIEKGVVAGELSRKLVSPTLPDGLSAEVQVENLKRLGGTRYPFDRLTRRSVVAPQIVRVPLPAPTDGDTPLRTVDIWFVVYAELDRVADPDFLGTLLNSQQDDGQAVTLTAAQLADRGIVIAKEDEDREAYGHLSYKLLGKVQISATGHSFWSQTGESIVGAVIVDPRFRDDAEFPNTWAFVDEPSEAHLTERAVPYDGLGFYVKVTRLQQPKGALFVEYHMVFAEPVQWFRGTNQLGAKLPAVLQSQVRTARREMMRASQ